MRWGWGWDGRIRTYKAYYWSEMGHSTCQQEGALATVVYHWAEAFVLNYYCIWYKIAKYGI
jgi:hypothetical protein